MIEEAIKLLNKNGREEILSTQIIIGGVNSKITKVHTLTGNYCIKQYNSADGKERQHREKEFLLICNNGGIMNIPRYIGSDQRNNITLMEWLEGETLEKLEDCDIDKIGDFIGKLIMLETRKGKDNGMGNASESYRSFEDIGEATKKRIEECNLLINSKVFSQTNVEAVERTKEELKEEIERFKIKQENLELWNPDKLKRYISPSDVGIHNTLKFGKELRFLDFEYAGYDDISKQIADWVMQPKQTFSVNQEKKTSDNNKQFIERE